MRTLLPWGALEPFLVAVESGNVKGLITAARKDSAAAKELGVHAIALLMAYPTDESRRELWRVFQNWQGICLCRLMREFARQQRRADRKAHERRCFAIARMACRRQKIGVA